MDAEIGFQIWILLRGINCQLPLRHPGGAPFVRLQVGLDGNEATIKNKTAANFKSGFLDLMC